MRCPRPQLAWQSQDWNPGHLSLRVRIPESGPSADCPGGRGHLGLGGASGASPRAWLRALPVWASETW